MAAARSRMCFIIIYIWFVVQVGFLFFAEAWPTKALLRALDQLQHARQIACRFQPHLDKPKTEACSDFFYSSVLISFTLHTHLALMNTSKHVKFRKKFAHSISTHRKLHKELVHRVISRRHTAVGQLADFQGGPSRTGGYDEHI